MINPRFAAVDEHSPRRGAASARASGTAVGHGRVFIQALAAMESVLAGAIAARDFAPAGSRTRQARHNTWVRLAPTQVAMLRDALARLRRQSTRLEHEHTALRRQAMTDALTGMLNRRAFFEHSLALRNVCRQRHQALSCLMLDVDYFKAINDTDGHQRGDETLIRLAQILQRSVRDSDVVCRYGGEEFAICMPAADAARATDLAERLRRRVECELGPPLALTARSTVTASIGVATSSNAQMRIESLLALADQAMYRAKQQGRNCVHASNCDG